MAMIPKTDMAPQLREQHSDAYYATSAGRSRTRAAAFLIVGTFATGVLIGIALTLGWFEMTGGACV